MHAPSRPQTNGLKSIPGTRRVCNPSTNACGGATARTLFFVWTMFRGVPLPSLAVTDDTNERRIDTSCISSGHFKANDENLSIASKWSRKNDLQVSLTCRGTAFSRRDRARRTAKSFFCEPAERERRR